MFSFCSSSFLDIYNKCERRKHLVTFKLVTWWEEMPTHLGLWSNRVWRREYTFPTNVSSLTNVSYLVWNWVFSSVYSWSCSGGFVLWPSWRPLSFGPRSWCRTCPSACSSWSQKQFQLLEEFRWGSGWSYCTAHLHLPQVLALHFSGELCSCWGYIEQHRCGRWQQSVVVVWVTVWTLRRQSRPGQCSHECFHVAHR